MNGLRFFRNKMKGFTLIEVVIVIAIIAILSVAALVSLVGSRVDSEVASATREVAAVIRSTQNAALSGEDVPRGRKICGYSVSGTGNSGSYQTEMLLGSQSNECDDPQSVISGYSLRNGVRFESNWRIDFGIPYGQAWSSFRVNIFKGSSSASICIGNGRTVNEIFDGGACP